MGYVGGGIAGLTLLVFILVLVLAVRRRRARRVTGRDEILRRASLAAGRIAKESRRARRGTMREGGTGEGSDPNSAATFGNDGPAGLP